MFKDIHYQVFGPIVTYYGYEVSLAVIDDLMITKVFTPDNRKQINYFTSEDEMIDYLDLINQDRRF
jgi:hypothetical protein